MKSVNFRKAISLLGYDIVEYNKGYNSRSAFATNRESGELYYFAISDLRQPNPMVYRRTAKHTKDYYGGTNRFDVEDMLADLGYHIVEPRGKSDYNKS